MLREYPESYQEAYELTKKAVKNEPKWEEAHNMMGNCLLNLGRYSEARDAFKKSVSPCTSLTLLLSLALKCIKDPYSFLQGEVKARLCHSTLKSR